MFTLRRCPIPALAATMLALLMGLLLVGFGAGPAQAASPTWGTQGAPYRTGILCPSATDGSAGTGTSTGTDTVALVDWELGSGRTGFATTGVQSTSGVDTGVLPTVATATSGVVAPGAAGFTSAAQIAAVAYLISTSGHSTDAATVAEVAEQIAELVGTPAGVACLNQGQSGLSRSVADSLWLQAQQLAGPYTVSMSVSPTLLTPGQTAVARATVVSALGYPVPGATVTFTPGNGSAITGPDGAASQSVTTPAASAGMTVAAFSASVSVATGLTELAGPGTVPVIEAAPPSAFTAQASVRLNLSADPVLKIVVSSTLALPASPIQSHLVVTGLLGHTAVVDMTVVGPVPADPDGTCRLVPSTAWAAGSTVGQSTVNMFGDGTVPGPLFSPARPGCYSVSSTLATQDAVPAVQRSVALGRVTVAVLPVTVGVVVGHLGSSLSGPVPVTATVAGSLGSAGSISGRLLGPVQPRAGSCQNLEWSAAPTATRIVSYASLHDGTQTISSASAKLPGCYAVALNYTFTVPDGRSVSATIAPDAAGAQVLLLAPFLQTADVAAWTSEGNVLTPTVSVYGSRRQAGSLQAALLWIVSPAAGCERADWSHAALVGTGPAKSTTGDGDYRLTTAAPKRPGCYKVVPSLTLPGLNATTAVFGQQDDVFGVTAPLVPFVPPAARVGPGHRRTWVTLALVGVVLSAASGQSVRWAHRMRHSLSD